MLPWPPSFMTSEMEKEKNPTTNNADVNKSKRNELSLNLTPTDKSNSQTNQVSSPVGQELVGLRYIDDTGSEPNLLEPSLIKLKTKNVDSDEQDERGDYSRNSSENNLICSIPIITEQPETGLLLPYHSPGLETLLDAGQVVVHMGNLRQNVIMDESTLCRMEVIDETRRVLLNVEEDNQDLMTKTSFRYRMYDRNKQEVIQVFSPSSSTCICLGASWHCMRRCRFEAIVYTPVGIVAGFVRRSRTKFVQEFEILNPNEELLLVLRGGPQDLEIYSIDFQDELGRLSVHGWAGIMHEVRRTSRDYGLTFPIDLDVRVKAVLIGAVFAIHWLYSTKGGKVNHSTA